MNQLKCSKDGFVTYLTVKVYYAYVRITIVVIGVITNVYALGCSPNWLVHPLYMCMVLVDCTRYICTYVYMVLKHLSAFIIKCRILMLFVCVSVCVYLCVYVCLCVYLCVFVYLCVSMYLSVFVYLCVFVCICVLVCVHVCVCVYLCTCVCPCVCVFVCCLFVYLCVYFCVLMCLCVLLCMIFVLVYMCTCVCTFVSVSVIYHVCLLMFLRLFWHTKRDLKWGN